MCITETTKQYAREMTRTPLPITAEVATLVLLSCVGGCGGGVHARVCEVVVVVVGGGRCLDQGRGSITVCVMVFVNDRKKPVFSWVSILILEKKISQSLSNSYRFRLP